MVQARLHCVLEVRGGARAREFGVTSLLFEVRVPGEEPFVLLRAVGATGFIIVAVVHSLIAILAVGASFAAYLVLTGTDFPRLCWP